MTINVFLPFLLFFSLSLNWEREIYNWVQGETVLKYTYLFDWVLRKVFSLLRAEGLYVIFSSGLKVWVLLLVLDYFCFLYPEFCARFAPICSRQPFLQNWFSFSLFPLTERRCHFRFRVLTNHLASTFFLPLSGDPSEATEYR